MWAAMEALRGKRKPMTAGQIYAEIRERNLAPALKGKTPEQIARPARGQRQARSLRRAHRAGQVPAQARRET